MLVTRDLEEMTKITDWSGKQVLVIGIARQGIALARYLSSKGAKVTVNDRRPLDQLMAARESLADLDIDWVTGNHPISILDSVELVCISGGVPLDNPLVIEARALGIPLSNDSQVFLEQCPCKVIGITGSAGKTTTTTLVGLIAQAAVEQIPAISYEVETENPGMIQLTPESNVWVGGNIGTPLISVLDEMKETDLAIMELSSFQLEIMRRSPNIAGLLNITPNHLDRHGTMEAYTAAKVRILEFQSSEDAAVLNFDDPIVRAYVKDVKGSLVGFGMQKTFADFPFIFYDPKSQSLCIEEQGLSGSVATEFLHHDSIPLRGEHNLMNVLAATAIGVACGFPASAIKQGVINFEGIAHRLEFVRTWRGADWYNDSIATAPERAIAAIKSFDEPIILLAGGRDKDLPWDDFASLVSRRVKHLIIFGEAAEIISAALNKYEKYSDLKVTCCLGLYEAVQAAAVAITPGDVVLLSPGGTSFDEFNNFEERGEAFRTWVMELE